jgi:hypothetical protein
MGIRRGDEDTPRLDREGAPSTTCARDGRVPAAAAGVRHRRQRLGQEHADAGRAVPGARAPLRQAHRDARQARGAARRRLVSEVVFVDQSPIGKTARSNPASYVGAFDEIRKLFATTPLAHRAQLRPGMFSFNAGDGRCPTCGGSGFEHVEMQFLSDVYLRCPDCDGKRYPRRDARRATWCGATASCRSPTCWS